VERSARAAGPALAYGKRGAPGSRSTAAALDAARLWELRAGPETFRSLQARCDGVSPSVLNARLAELREAGIVELREGEGYALAPLGAALLAALAPLREWSEAWARRSRPY
jgi:DNA-binding HxlR family transcriptional regulator